MHELKFIEDLKEEARVNRGREDILQVLEAKFGRRAGAEFAPLLKDVTKTAELDRLLRMAARAASADQFRDHFQKA